MNEYNFNVNFELGKIDTDLINLVQNDYNSTKINFTFDKEGKIEFKLLFPDQTAYIKEIENNEIILSEGMLAQSGKYKIEISLYGDDSKLTNYATHTFTVRNELVNVDDIVEIDDRVPILSQLINEVSGLENTLEENEEERTTNEVERQENENARISNESQRISNENERQVQEEARETYIEELKEEVDNGRFDGEDGYTPNVKVGTTSTLEAGSQATVTRTGTLEEPIFNFGIPKGETGTKGEKGEKGDKGDKGDTGEKGQDGINGRDGYVQYTAGKNISINGNVINAEVPEIDLSNYYNKNEVNNITGSLNDLDTENKTNLVNAINELVNASSDTGIIDLGENPQISIATSMHSIVGTHNPGVYIMNGAGTKITYGRNLTDNPISYNGINGLLIITGGDLTSGADQVGYFFAGDRGMTITTYYNKNMYKNLLYNTANYNIAGTFTKEQTFDVLPKSAVVPTNDNQLVNKKYVDNAIASAITDALEGEY